MPRAVKQHLIQRSDGRYRCKYKGLEFYGRTEDEAFAARDEYIQQNKRTTRTTVADYALPWLRRTYHHVADSTYAGLATHLQHMIDVIGNKKISDVVPSDIKLIYSTKYSGLSNTYIKSAKQLYCSLFDSATADRVIWFNPARDKAAKPPRGAKKREMSLGRRQREWIETLCTDHRVHPAAMAMLYAGLRPQEMKALDIDRDVDFENDIITVRQTAHVDGQKYTITGDMKTDWSCRTVPLFPPLKRALKGKHGCLITSAHGEPVTIQTWKVAWNSYKTAMETAINGCHKRWYGKTKAHKAMEKLPEWVEFDIVPYTLRHAFCAFCRDSGVEINTCRKWMGHADTQMILKVYDSVSDDRFQQERQKIDSLYNSDV